MAADTYNKVFSMHGLIMVFFFLVPSVPATIGNFVIPMMVGAKDLALPKINLLSWYLYVLARPHDALHDGRPAASTPAGPSPRRSPRII